MLRLEKLEEIARSMALAMEFGFLIDRKRNLLSIGYLASGRRARSPIAMTFWRPKRGWRVFSPSPRAMFPPATGFILAARQPPSLMAPR